MIHALMKLPFDKCALEPHISSETIEYHYGKHHAGYVSKLNSLIKDTAYEDMTLEEIIKEADGSVFNNASQVYNHDFYFNGISDKESELSENLSILISQYFVSYSQLKETFIELALGLFGSGWVWLCVNKSGKLVIEVHQNAGNPLSSGHIPLLTCDVWEHAYYIDHKNARAAYLEKWWGLINWDFVSQNLVKNEYIEFPCDENSGTCEYVA